MRFAADLSSIDFEDGGRLHFDKWAERSAHHQPDLVRSAYRQPFGTFTGALPGGVRLASARGVMESHEAFW